MQSFAQQVTARDPEGAVSWAGTIADETRRRKTLERVARDWLERDRNAATEWIRSTPLLTEEARQRMLGNK